MKNTLRPQKVFQDAKTENAPRRNHSTKLGKNRALGVGASSMLMVFALLALIIFAVLSLVSARSDKALNDKALQHMASYYAAENAAEQTLGQVDSLLADAYFAKGNYSDEVFARLAQHTEFAVSKENGRLLLRYEVAINEHQTLAVTLQVVDPSSAEDVFYRIVEWRTVTKEEWTPNEKLPVYGAEK